MKNKLKIQILLYVTVLIGAFLASIDSTIDLSKSVGISVIIMMCTGVIFINSLKLISRWKIKSSALRLLICFSALILCNALGCLIMLLLNVPSLNIAWSVMGGLLGLILPITVYIIIIFMAKFENASNYYRAGKIDEAIKECNKLSKLKNNRKLAYTWLGYLYIQKEMYDKAITYYEKAVEIDPNDQELLYSCALAYYRSGNIKMAKNYWEKIGLNYVEMPGNELHFRITSPNIENVALLKSKYLIKEVS